MTTTATSQTNVIPAASTKTILANVDVPRHSAWPAAPHRKGEPAPREGRFRFTERCEYLATCERQ